jgi:hypothetical protein
MQVDSVKDVTTRESAITYQVTLRITCLDMKEDEAQFTNKLNSAVLKAINGISTYPYYTE